jgi:hypothetical protein
MRRRFKLSFTLTLIAIAFATAAGPAAATPDLSGVHAWRDADGSVRFVAPTINGNLHGALRGVEADLLHAEMWLEHAPHDAADVKLRFRARDVLAVDLELFDAAGSLGDLWVRFDATGDAPQGWELLRHGIADCERARLAPIYIGLVSLAEELGPAVASLAVPEHAASLEALAALPILLATRLPAALEDCPALHRGSSGECAAARDYSQCEECCEALGDELGGACDIFAAACAAIRRPCGAARAACNPIRSFTYSTCLDSSCMGKPGDPSCDEEEAEPCGDVGGVCQVTCLITKKQVCGTCPEEELCCR